MPKENQDLGCNKFKYVVTAPHDEPIHMHFRYGDEQSNFEALLKMSNAIALNSDLNPMQIATEEQIQKARQSP
jgi:hypothetical protein